MNDGRKLFNFAKAFNINYSGRIAIYSFTKDQKGQIVELQSDTMKLIKQSFILN